MSDRHPVLDLTGFDLDNFDGCGTCGNPIWFGVAHERSGEVVIRCRRCLPPRPGATILGWVDVKAKAMLDGPPRER